MNDPGALVGRVILIGVSVYRDDGVFLRKTQVHGIVKEIDPEAGVVVKEAVSGHEFYLPPAFAHIHAAPPGIYRARDTGDEIENPDFITQWAVRLPSAADEATIDWQQPMDWHAERPPDQTRSGLQ